MLETLDYTICIGSTPPILHFDLYIYIYTYISERSYWMTASLYRKYNTFSDRESEQQHRTMTSAVLPNHPLLLTMLTSLAKHIPLTWHIAGFQRIGYNWQVTKFSTRIHLFEDCQDIWIRNWCHYYLGLTDNATSTVKTNKFHLQFEFLNTEATIPVFQHVYDNQ